MALIGHTRQFLIPFIKTWWNESRAQRIDDEDETEKGTKRNITTKQWVADSLLLPAYDIENEYRTMGM